MKKFTAVVLAILTIIMVGCSAEPTLSDPYGYRASAGEVTEAKLNDMTYIMQIDDYGISKQYFADLIMANAAQYTQGDVALLADGSDESKEFYEIIKEFSAEYIIQEAAFRKMADDLGIEITEEDEVTIQANLDSYIAQSGGEDAFNQVLEQSGISIEFYNNQLYMSELSNKIYTYYSDPANGNTLSNEELKAIAEESYVMVKHVLVDDTSLEGAVDADGNAFESLEDLANSITERARDGENFDLLIEEYNIDPGMESNPEGYFFTYDVMVPEFEEESFEMEVGDISDPVQTDYGYHIIQKIEITDQVLEENLETLSGEHTVNLLEESITQYVEELNVVYTSQYDNITIDILFPDMFVSTVG